MIFLDITSHLNLSVWIGFASELEQHLPSPQEPYILEDPDNFIPANPLVIKNSYWRTQRTHNEY
jgi:hypothetical protein